MKRPLVSTALALVLGVAGLPVLGQPTIYVSPDVPTDADGADLLPWEVIEHVHLSATPYTLEFSIPGDPAIDALMLQSFDFQCFPSSPYLSDQIRNPQLPVDMALYCQ